MRICEYIWWKKRKKKCACPVTGGVRVWRFLGLIGTKCSDFPGFMKDDNMIDLVIQDFNRSFLLLRLGLVGAVIVATMS